MLKSGKKIGTLLLLVVIGFGLLSSPTELCARERPSSNEDSYDGFVDSIGRLIYWYAWPTAEYERVTFDGFKPASGGADLRITLHGKSAWSGESLWTKVVVELRNGDIKDIHFGRNNAILAPPGSTMEALGQLLVEVNKEYDRTHPASGGSSIPAPLESQVFYGYHFTNKCKLSARLAIRYVNSKDEWETQGWWTFKPGESAYLSLGDRRIRATHSTWYFYAETMTGNYVWKGDISRSFDGRTLKMIKKEDKEGDNDFAITCN